MRFARWLTYLCTTTGFSDRLGTRMAERGIYNMLQQAIQDVVAPQPQELKGEIVGLRGEIRQIVKRMEEGFAAGRNKVNSLRNEMNV